MRYKYTPEVHFGKNDKPLCGVARYVEASGGWEFFRNYCFSTDIINCEKCIELLLEVRGKEYAKLEAKLKRIQDRKEKENANKTENAQDVKGS